MFLSYTILWLLDIIRSKTQLYNISKLKDVLPLSHFICTFRFWRGNLVHMGNDIITPIQSTLTIFNDKLMNDWWQEALERSLCSFFYPVSSNAWSLCQLYQHIDGSLSYIDYHFGTKFEPQNVQIKWDVM